MSKEYYEKEYKDFLKNNAEEIEELKIRAEKGDSEAMHELAYKLYDNRISRTKDLLLNWLKKAGEYGNVEAQFALGHTFIDDEKAAFFWLKNAADQNHASAQFFLGLKYIRGHGCEKDYLEALKYLRLGAKNSNEYFEAQHLGKMFYFGEDVEQDKEEGKKWLRLAGRRGSKEARAFLRSIKSSENKEEI